METRNLIILCIWIFVLALLVGLWWIGERLIFEGYLLLFFIALISSIIVAYLLQEKRS
ncbi:MAG: hypothetical protein ACFFCW_41900 [Candidatus Hodarchaeota archaeon]